MGKNLKVIGIDPGLSGAIVYTDGKAEIRTSEMPVTRGKDRCVDYSDFHGILTIFGGDDFANRPHVFLERAVSFGMGTKSAFNYGRGFEAIVIALTQLKFPFTMVEPNKWFKEMTQGTPANWKPKERSALAMKRLYPALAEKLPTKPRGGLHDGMVDALLIAGYGLRQLGVVDSVDDPGDFY